MFLIGIFLCKHTLLADLCGVYNLRQGINRCLFLSIGKWCSLAWLHALFGKIELLLLLLDLETVVGTTAKRQDLLCIWVCRLIFIVNFKSFISPIFIILTMSILLYCKSLGLQYSLCSIAMTWSLEFHSICTYSSIRSSSKTSLFRKSLLSEFLFFAWTSYVCVYWNFTFFLCVHKRTKSVVRRVRKTHRWVCWKIWKLTDVVVLTENLLVLNQLVLNQVWTLSHVKVTSVVEVVRVHINKSL